MVQDKGHCPIKGDKGYSSKGRKVSYFMIYLDDSRVVGQPTSQDRLRLGRLAHANVTDVASTKHDVLVNLVPGRDRAIRGAVFGAHRFYYNEENAEPNMRR